MTYYLQEVKDKVASYKQEREDAYKLFVDEVVVPDFATTSTENSTITKESLIGEGIVPLDFITWLEMQGFTVVSKKDNRFIIVSM